MIFIIVVLIIIIIIIWGSTATYSYHMSIQHPAPAGHSGDPSLWLEPPRALRALFASLPGSQIQNGGDAKNWEKW